MTTSPQPLAIFRDTVSPELMKIDDTYQGVLAYATGKYAWPTAQVSRFIAAGKHLYRVAVTVAPHLASIIDVESGAATFTEAANFIRDRNSLKGDGTAYADLNNVGALVDAIGDEPAWLIIADWTGEPHVPAVELPANIRLAGVQYENTPLWDLTAIYSDEWLGKGSVAR